MPAAALDATAIAAETAEGPVVPGGQAARDDIAWAGAGGVPTASGRPGPA